MAAGLVAGLGLWIVHGVLHGVPGPVVAGVYLNGAGELLMDRRFNRRKFDAEQVAESFSFRMSSTTNTDDPASDLTATLERTLAPSSIGICIRD